MKKAAVIPSTGIGDALLMMNASHRLQKQGYEVATFHTSLSELTAWFPNHNLQKNFSEQDLSSFDLIIVENDNSSKITLLKEIYRERLSIFYPSYSPQKHGALFSLDQVFNSDLSMAENVSWAITNLLQIPFESNENGITPPGSLIHRLHSKRVLIHPTSREVKKNWLSSQFLKLAYQLKEKGFEPLFCLSPQERKEWIGYGYQISAPEFPTLSHLAKEVYQAGYVIGNDSMLGHLASSLHIPTLIIADDEKRMRLWRPGWLKGHVVTTPAWVPNPRFLRLKQNHWQRFISVEKVLQSFHEMSTHLQNSP